MKLFHFTYRWTLPSILNHGLDHGDIPLSYTEGINGISLTEDGSASARIQRWCARLNDKLAIRLTVDIDQCPRLMRWRYVPNIVRMDRAFWKLLKGDPYKWWVYFGEIPAVQISEVFDTRMQRVLTAEEIESAKHEKQERGKLIKAVKWVAFEDAIVK